LIAQYPLQVQSDCGPTVPLQFRIRWIKRLRKSNPDLYSNLLLLYNLIYKFRHIYFGIESQTDCLAERIEKAQPMEHCLFSWIDERGEPSSGMKHQRLITAIGSDLVLNSILHF
jgi:hypothetical protein